MNALQIESVIGLNRHHVIAKDELGRLVESEVDQSHVLMHDSEHEVGSREWLRSYLTKTMCWPRLFSWTITTHLDVDKLEPETRSFTCEKLRW